jgi:hypothetical protein
MNEGTNAQSLTCSARLRLQARTVPRVDSMLSEFPAAPPTLSPAGSGRGEQSAVMDDNHRCHPLLKH